MTTSSSWDYSVTAAQIITAAAENLSIITTGGTIAPADQTAMLQRLNFIAKQWQGKADMAQGLKVHTRQRVTLFLAKGQQRYTIGPASGDSRASTQYGRTTVSANYASGTSLNVTALTDTTTYPGTTVTMTAADIIGVVLNDGTIGWTTISSAASSPITLGGGLASAANAGNYVYWFTSRAQRFPVIEYANLRTFDTSTFGKATDMPLYIYRDVQSYEAASSKTGDGDPLSILVEPGRLNTAVTLNSQPTDVSKVVNLTTLYPAEDYDATTNDIAFPQEWFAALEWELTLRCIPLFPQDWTPAMEKNYQNATGIARELNQDNTEMHFAPGRD